MPHRHARLTSIVWTTALIAAGCVLVIALLTAGAMYVWAQVVPPLKAEPTPNGLRVEINRAALRNLRISVNGGTPVTRTELTRGVIVLPWSEFDLADASAVPGDVREVHATGTGPLRHFETTLSFTSFPDGSAATAQTLNYVTTAAEH